MKIGNIKNCMKERINKENNNNYNKSFYINEINESYAKNIINDIINY